MVRALVAENQSGAAEAALRQITADDPRSADAWRMLGRVLIQAGDVDGAAAALERSLRVNRRQGGAWYELTRSRRMTEADRPLIVRMHAAARNITVAGEQVKLCLALGKAFDDLGDPELAMRHFAEANRIRAPLSRFDRAGFSRRIDALIACFSRGFVAAHAARGDPSPRPVMIVGLPRSGATLLEQILSSHPAVASAGASSFWRERDGMLQTGAAPTAVTQLQTRVAGDALDHLAAIAPAAERVIDRNAFNFLHAGLIHLVFPRAVILHCRRQAADTCLSIASTYLAPRSDFPAEPADLVFYHREYGRLTDHWRAVLPTDRFLDVDYEAVVADPEAVARRLVGALGLPWDDACLRPAGHRGEVDRWRRYEPWLGDLRALIPASSATAAASA
jgi:hypothetical protein